MDIQQNHHRRPKQVRDKTNNETPTTSSITTATTNIINDTMSPRGEAFARAEGQQQIEETKEAERKENMQSKPTLIPNANQNEEREKAITPNSDITNNEATTTSPNTTTNNKLPTDKPDKIPSTTPKSWPIFTTNNNNQPQSTTKGGQKRRNNKRPSNPLKINPKAVPRLPSPSQLRMRPTVPAHVNLDAIFPQLSENT